VLHERCAECGFDAAGWTDADAMEALAAMPDRWAAVVAGVAGEDLPRRLVDDRWSIAEYVDHVRETMFSMRFVLDVAVDAPGTDLGAPTAPDLDPTPRAVDTARAMATFTDEVRQLCRRLHEVPSSAWTSHAVLWARPVDVRWVLHNSLHETSHHLGDITHLAAVAGPRR
jgi:hypothetical protein